MDAPLVRRFGVRSALLAFALAVASLAWLVPGEARAQTASPLTAEMQTAIRAAASAQTGTPAANVTILRSLPVTWSDACLGGSSTDPVCITVLTPGWVVWVDAGGTVARFHTDLAMGTINFSSSNILASQVDAAPLPAGATFRFVPVRVITGEVPPEGVGLFAISEASTTTAIIEELQGGGCAVVTLAVTVDGKFVVYVPGAPDFVNADFGVDFGADRAFAVRCGQGDEFRDFDTDAVNRTARIGNGVLTAVRIAEHDGYDRIVFEFGDELGDIDINNGVPAYRIEYIDGPAVACGSGNEVQPEGSAILQVSLPGTYVYDPETGEPTIEQRMYGEDYNVIFEAQEICAFEADSTWAIGTGGEAPFRVYELSNPTRLVIDVESSDD